MRSNYVRAKLKRGESSVGTWLTLPDSVAAYLMTRVGFDWLSVDMEHGPVTIEHAAHSFALISNSGLVPLARVPSHSVENIKRVLDTGAWGIVVPMVNSRADAEAVVNATRYAPLGRRSIGGQLHAPNFDTDPATYYQRANEEILVIVMIEHVKGVEAADDILSVPGIDVAFIGPNDLHHSMGKRPTFESDDNEFVDAVKHVRQTARKHGVTPGIHVLDAESAQRRIAEGFQFIAIASEAGMMLAKAGEIASALGLSKRAGVAKY